MHHDRFDFLIYFLPTGPCLYHPAQISWRNAPAGVWHEPTEWDGAEVSQLQMNLTARNVTFLREI